MADAGSSKANQTAVPTKSGGKAVGALVCGICSLLIGSWCCFLWLPLGIIAMVLGKQEERAIAEGTSAESGRALAQWGFWLGLVSIFIGILLTILAVLGVFTSLLQEYVPNYPW